MSDLVAISSDELTVEINPLGSELWSITDAAGRSYMTDGDRRWWTGHAPILFPIVGALRDDRYRLDGKEYALGKHGFARHNRFDIVKEAKDRASFRLKDSEETRRHYPFAFALEIAFTVAGNRLSLEATVTNRDEASLPFSFGFHPAFAWPLPGDAPKSAHRVTFAQAELEAIRRIEPASGLLLPEPQPTPVDGDTLVPTAELFELDALIWDRLHSRFCTFGAPGSGTVALEFPDTHLLGIWQKPGAPFLCIEPWNGLADPLGFDGDLRTKPGIMELAPGASRSFHLAITITPPGDTQ